MPANPAAPPVSLTLSVEGLAAELHATVKTIGRWDAVGKIPRPLRVGRRLLWPRAEIVDWIAAGCPNRREWDARQSVGRGAKR